MAILLNSYGAGKLLYSHCSAGSVSVLHSTVYSGVFFLMLISCQWKFTLILNICTISNNDILVYVSSNNKLPLHPLTYGRCGMQFQIAAKGMTCVWVAFILNGTPNAAWFCCDCDATKRVKIAEKSSLSKCGLWASLERQLCIRQPIQGNEWIALPKLLEGTCVPAKAICESGLICSLLVC